ncbi:glutathione ABC transporter substrate-binding protein [Alkaliphilus transvaalensis]|uniref:glutathione ABC transporter substrate-binding protein n=1 Tax=Alkaliphilus transvaalensis TaxID=114628 RepID=UPI00047D111C|nr:glutathione ABC transporter substrate-binding protein [Alkaliphilus transvaalensis]
MKKNRKMLALLSLMLVVVLVAVGCGSTTDAPVTGDDKPSVAKDELIIASPSDAVSLDPHGTNDASSALVMKQIYETLVVQDENMDLKPGLATSWEKIDDLTFEFKLREGVKFHNGEDFTAKDVEFTLLRALKSDHIGHIVGPINSEAIEIIDDYTIRIGTSEPFAPLLAHLAHGASGMLNEKAVTEKGDDYGQHPVGTGPFMLANWSNGEFIELTRFDDHHSVKPEFKTMTFKAISEATNRTIELEIGSIDIANNVTPNEIKRIEDNSDLILLRDPSLGNNYIGFNLTKAPFDDVRVRQAINYALDVDTIVEAVYQGVGSPAAGALGPSVFAAHTGLEQYGYNVEKAKELMKEAGLENGFSTTIWVNDGNRQRMDIAEILQNQLQQINITTDVQVLEWGAYLENTSKGEHDMFILGWTTVTGDPDYGLYALFHSTQHGPAGNRTFYSNPKVDELLDSARRTADPAERERLYKEAQEIIRDEAPWIFVQDNENLVGIRNNISGLSLHPAGHHIFYNVSFK